LFRSGTLCPELRNRHLVFFPPFSVFLISSIWRWFIPTQVEIYIWRWWKCVNSKW
jgi:hypothetical protein